ncbi:dystroglycan-like [Dorcoceras hygrometricum]|uniref:Dystroglycan-like n=1 Tax=Dorcoceras hygrometricum TaxID=472368 RepID=A0A2Z7D7B1_9LAMI|nr:dystroglycan-like [Dorcoceras hygrometricum]
MADQTDEDEVFDFSNVEFTRDDLVIALNDMVKEYRKLSHSFEEAKAENMSLKSSSAESSSDELEDADILKTELSKLQAENELLRNEISELKAEVAKSTVEMSSWNKANLTLQKLYESQKQASDKTGIGFNNSEFGEGEPIVPEKSNAIVEAVTTGYESLSPSCDGLTGPDDHGPMISRLIDRDFTGILFNYLQFEMASSFYSNAQHVDFESVLGMDDHGMVSMFEALMASGLRGFLGCPAVVYEDALVDFFENASVRSGVIISTVGGQLVELSEELFAESFELPVDGFGDLSEIPKDAIFDAKSIVSLSGEPISLSGRKNQMKILFRLLCDIMAKAISVKAGSFNAITVEKFSLITAVVCRIKMNWAKFLFSILKKMISPGSKQAKGFAIQISLLLETFPSLELGESSAFPASKVLTKKTVLRFVSINDRDGAEEVTGAAKKKAVSKKRPAADVGAAVPKKKRSFKKKSVSSMELVEVAEEAIPIQQVAEPLDVEEPRCSYADAVDLIIQQQWEAERPVVTASDTEEDIATVDVAPADGDQQVQEFVAPISAEDTLSADERMSLDDILLTIPVNIPLPSSSMEITKITMGKSVKIPGVTKWTWFLQSLPRIPVNDKGKQILVEKDPVKGNPAKEHYSLICADIDLLVSLRAQVIDEVAKFFHSFSLRKLASINLEDMYKKEEQVLHWGETESPQVAIQRKFYILLKYRTVLVWKFLDAWRANFVPGQGSSAVDIQVIELLSDLYLSFLEELAKEARAHNLIWNKPCCSKIFEGSQRDRGAVIARTNSNTRSTCWIRKMIMVDGLWTVELCADKWVKIPRKVISTEVPRQRQFDDTLPSMSVFFRLMKKRWADVCLEVTDFCASRRLLPVGSINFCRALEIVETDSCFASRQPTVFSLRLSQFCTIHIQYSLFSSLSTADISEFLSAIALDRTVLRSVQSFQSSFSVAPSVQLSLEQQQSSSSSSSSSSSLHFDKTDVDATASSVAQFTFSTNASIFQVLADVRHEVEAVNAKVDIMASRLNAIQKDAEATKEALSHQLLEFQSSAQENHNVIHAQLSELVDYIHRGSADKKGESGSRGLQQPASTQIEGSAVTPTFAQRVEMAKRRIVHTVLDADRDTAERDRERRKEARSLFIYSGISAVGVFKISAVGVFVRFQQMVCDQQLNDLSSSADRFFKSIQQMLLSRSASTDLCFQRVLLRSVNDSVLIS